MDRWKMHRVSFCSLTLWTLDTENSARSPISGSFLDFLRLLCTGYVPLRADKCRVTSRDFLKFLSTLRQALTALFHESSESDTVLEMGGRWEKIGKEIDTESEGEQIFLGVVRRKGEEDGGGSFAFLHFIFSERWLQHRLGNVFVVTALFSCSEEETGEAALHVLSRSANAFR